MDYKSKTNDEVSKLPIDELLKTPKRKRPRVVDNRANKAKFVVKIEDKYMAIALLSKAQDLGLIVDKDNFLRQVGGCISFGTSKHFDVAGNNREEFYPSKRNIDPIKLTSKNWNSISDLLDLFIEAKEAEKGLTLSTGVKVQVGHSGVVFSETVSTISYSDLAQLISFIENQKSKN